MKVCNQAIIAICGMSLLLMCQSVLSYSQTVPIPNVFGVSPNPLETAKSIYQSRSINPDNYTERLKKIEELFEQGEYLKVQEESKAVLMLDSINERLLVLMAETSRILGDTMSMNRYAQRLNYHHPLNTSAFVIPAVYYLQSDQVQKAEDLLNDAFKRDKNDPYANYYMSILSAEKGDLNKALKWASKSLKYAENPYDAAMFYGYLLLSKPKPKYREALKYFDLVSMHDPKGTSSIYQGYCLYMCEEWDESALKLKSFLLKVPDHPLSLMLLASIEANRNQTSASLEYLKALQKALQESQYFIKEAGFSEILKALEDMSEDSPAKKELLLALSDIFILDDRCITSKVLERYQSGIFYCEHFKVVLLSVIGFSGQEAKEGLKWIDRAYACDTSSIFTNMLISSLYIQMNNMEYALAFNEKAIEYGADNFQVFYTAALLASRLEKYGRALDLYGIAVSKRENYAPLHTDYAMCALASGDSSLAYQQANLSVKLQPTFPAPYRLLSQLYFSKQEFQKSLDYIDQAIHRGAEAEDYYHRALLRDTLGFDSNVEDDLKRAYLLDSSMVKASYRLGLIGWDKSHYESAVYYFKSAALQGHLPSLKSYGQLLVWMNDTLAWDYMLQQLRKDKRFSQNQLLSLARSFTLEGQYFLANTLYENALKNSTLEYKDQAEMILCRLALSDTSNAQSAFRAISEGYQSRESYLVIKNLIALKTGAINPSGFEWPQSIEMQLSQSSFVVLAKLVMQNLKISPEQMHTWAPWMEQ